LYTTGFILFFSFSFFLSFAFAYFSSYCQRTNTTFISLSLLVFLEFVFSSLYLVFSFLSL
jgi:hypothetical protein